MFDSTLSKINAVDQRNTSLLHLFQRYHTLFSLVLGFAITLLTLFCFLIFQDTVNRTQDFITDMQIHLTHHKPASTIPVIVHVDEKSLKEIGQWPWSRYQMATLVNRLNNAGVQSIGIDAIFAEADRTSPLQIKAAIQRDFQSNLSIDQIPADNQDYDLLFAKSLQSTPSVLGYFFSFDKAAVKGCNPTSSTGVLLSVNNSSANNSSANNSPATQETNTAPTEPICSVPPLRQAAHGAGFTNSAPDIDGIYRRTPLIMLWQGRYYPNLALQTYMTALNIHQFTVTPQLGGYSLKVGNKDIPLDSAGNLILRFRGPNHTYNYISAVDVLKNRVSSAELKDKIVMIGFSATGLNEFRAIYNDPYFPGVEYHAAVIDNLIQGDFLSRSDHNKIFELLIALIAGMALTLILAKGGPVSSTLIPSIMAVALIAGSQALIAFKGVIISPVLPLLTMLLVLFALLFLKYTRAYFKALQMQKNILHSHEAIIQSICTMSEYRDPETGEHILRTQNYVRALAKRLQKTPKFKHYLDDATIDMLYKAAPLHDIGKIGIRDAILKKPSLLNDDEYEIMKTHTEIGATILRSVNKRLSNNTFMQIAEEIVLYHQEKWDGSGYPEHLHGENIPISARLMALADVYDALISKRVYKPAFPHMQAVSIIAEGKGTHFDPDMVDAFLDIHEEFKLIALKFIDNKEQRDALLSDFVFEDKKGDKDA